MRCRHCNALLLPVPLGTNYTASCSCGAGYLIEVAEVFQPTIQTEKLETMRQYHKPGSY